MTKTSLQSGIEPLDSYSCISADFNLLLSGKSFFEGVDRE